jgi:hypothetical protein
MKTKFIFFLLFISLVASSQEKITTNVFTLNLSKPSTESLKSTDKKSKTLSIQSREPLQLELEGGNPFKYNYVINNKLVNFFEDKSDNPLAKVQSIINKQPVTGTTSEEEKSIKDKAKEVSDLEKELERLKKEKKELTAKGRQTHLREIQEVDAKIETATNNVNELKEKPYTPLANGSFDILRRDDPNKSKAMNVDEDKNIVYFALLDIVNRAEMELTKMIEFKTSIMSSEILDIENFEKEKKQFNNKLELIIKDYSIVKRDQIRFKDFSDLTNKYDAEVIKFKSVIDLLSAELLRCNSVKKEHYTLPIDINGKNIDAVEITVERFEKDNPVAIDKYKYNIWVKGGLKIDISGGVFLTSLVNNEYFTKDKIVNEGGVDVTKQQIFRKEKGNFEFGFGSAINISLRSASWINPTLNAGALFTVNQQFQIITGLGAILGKEERIIFSGGLTMGRVTKISEAYKEDGSVTYDLGDGVVPTDSVFDFGFYFGITYNFSKNKTQK